MKFSAGEFVTIPSPIDVHVHLREPGGEDKETIATGTYAALMGGYQAVIDMPNNPGGNETWTEARLDQKAAIARRTAYTNIGFYAGVNLADPAFREFPALVRKSAGLKLYMDHTTGNTEQRDLQTVRPTIDTWIADARSSGLMPPILLHAREGIGAETAGYIASQQYPVHWCHISTESEANAAEDLTEKFPDYYTGGVTPHHLTMTQRNADFQQGWNGARMQPPLGKEVDAEALRYFYNRRSIQILETDHAPHTNVDKMRTEATNPEGNTGVDDKTCFGVSGVEFVLPVMMSLVQRRLTTFNQVIDSLHTQPMRMLGIQALSSVAIANTTTLRISPYQIGEDDAFGKSLNTPYLGWTGWAEVVSIRRGGVEVYNSDSDDEVERKAVQILGGV